VSVHKVYFLRKMWLAAGESATEQMCFWWILGQLPIRVGVNEPCKAFPSITLGESEISQAECKSRIRLKHVEAAVVRVR